MHYILSIFCVLMLFGALAFIITNPLLVLACLAGFHLVKYLAKELKRK